MGFRATPSALNTPAAQMGQIGGFGKEEANSRRAPRNNKNRSNFQRHWKTKLLLTLFSIIFETRLFLYDTKYSFNFT